MKINLPNGYFIKDDGESYTLGKMVKKNIKNKDTGEISEGEGEQYICFPATIEYALKKYARIENIDYEGNFQGYVDRFTETLQKITKGL